MKQKRLSRIYFYKKEVQLVEKQMSQLPKLGLSDSSLHFPDDELTFYDLTEDRSLDMVLKVVDYLIWEKMPGPVETKEVFDALRSRLFVLLTFEDMGSTENVMKKLSRFDVLLISP